MLCGEGFTCPILIVGGWIEIVQDFIVAVRRQFCLILGNTALEVIVMDQTERSSVRLLKRSSDELNRCVRGAVWSRSMTRSSMAVTEIFCGMNQLSAVKVSEMGWMSR